MKIIVCVKSVPDTTAKISLASDRSSIQTEGIKWVMNPYDEFAVEQALILKDTQPEVEVVVLCYGHAKSSEAIRTALAMGADRAIFIKDEHASQKDGLAVSKILFKALEADGEPDMILMGRQAIDTDRSQVPQMLAQRYNIPHVTFVSGFEFKTDHVLATRDIDAGAKEIWKVPAFSVFACTKGINTPRYPSLKGIMAAKKKPLQEKSLSGLGFQETSFNSIELKGFELPSQERKKKMWQGATQENVDALILALREEAKVI